LRLYEGLFLFDANLASRDWPGIEKHVEDLLKRCSGKLVYSERWPDRKLAYEIRNCRKGTYYLTYFNAPPEGVATLRRDCQLSERVLRVMVTCNEHTEELLEQRRARAEASEQESDAKESAAAAKSEAPAEVKAAEPVAAEPPAEATPAPKPEGGAAE